MNGLSAQKLPNRIAGLNELAYNLWWSWHPEARSLFKSLDRPLWKSTSHNPVKLLQQIPAYRLVAAAEDPAFIEKYELIVDSLQTSLTDSETWYNTNFPQFYHDVIAYFSMEFAIHNSLPMYAGGLGILAGDYLKEASDLGLPMVGVGFMYPQGYFRQHISEDGWQEEVYNHLDFSGAPIKPVLDENKQPLKIEVELDSSAIRAALWQVNVGRVRLFLLDTDVDDNSPSDRQLSARLYGGDNELRLRQEIVLGIGGVRALRALGLQPSVWHANEGHTVFMTLERCRELVQNGISFSEALERVQATTVFTTHTPVPAGNDTFPYSLIDKYFYRYWHALGLDRDSFVKLGVADSDAYFNMTALGLRMSHHHNGVSQLHGAVCRRMWSCVWPCCEEKEVPISSVTNGIHVPSWVAPQMANLYQKHLGPDWMAKHDEADAWECTGDIPDEELWTARRWLKSKLINFMQERARQRWIKERVSPAQTLAMGALLDAEALTIGFSRRFTDYKRAGLILSDFNRLKRILLNELKPVQIVFASKAHPNDHRGKSLIQQVFRLAKDPEFGGRIAFVEDYDMHVARYLVQGVDIWLNTPRQLQEASGTSGMKAALNGVVNLSVLDGWWYEGYNGANGWAIHNDVESGDSDNQDKADTDELYHLLEDTIVPLYYERDLNGIPHSWLRVVKQSIRSNVPAFSARRMTKEYTKQMYIPAARASKGVQERPLSIVQ